MDVAKPGFGIRLKELRLAAGLTQQALADKAGLKQTSLSDWECGKVSATVDAIPTLAEALGVTVADLFAPPAAEKPKPGRISTKGKPRSPRKGRGKSQK
jgi:transcriptional regulator with XRE-family HTH domain